MNHPVDGIDPEGFRCGSVSTRARLRMRVHTCNVHADGDVPFARGASSTGPRPAFDLSSTNEFRFSAVGCHVKLHRRASLSRTATCTHAVIVGARAEGSNTEESDVSGMSGP